VFLDGLFLHGRRVPANLPVGRDLTIRCKIESSRYYCAFGLRKPINESGHHVALNPRGPVIIFGAPLRSALMVTAPLSVAGGGGGTKGVPARFQRAAPRRTKGWLEASSEMEARQGGARNLGVGLHSHQQFLDAAGRHHGVSTAEVVERATTAGG
jgi:hypothetical protein